MRTGPVLAGAALSLLLLAACREASILEAEADVRWVAVSAGGAHTCGLAEDGRIACWGSNSAGQLGRDPRAERVSVPSLLGDFRSYRAVSAGEAHTCALDQEGAVWCWGSNATGQLGDGTTLDLPRPRRARVGAGFTAVSAGGGHTCALHRDGRAVCWGDNRKGQAGTGFPGSIAPPGAVADGELRFTAVAAGGEHTCGIARSGEAHCWGQNDAGQLGTGSRNSSPVPNGVAGSHLYRQLDAGGDHNCGVRTSGEVLCWGGNHLGQSGTFESAVVGTPLQPGWVDQGLRAVAGLGPWSCAAELQGDLVCWGARIGVVVEGRIPPAEGSWVLELPLSGEGGARNPVPSAGGAHACLLSPQGRIYCFGEGREGQLGNGQRRSSPDLVRVGRGG